jgi:hypothetical protein
LVVGPDGAVTLDAESPEHQLDAVGERGVETGGRAVVARGLIAREPDPRVLRRNVFGRPHRVEDVGGEFEVEHLLNGDGEDAVESVLRGLVGGEPPEVQTPVRVLRQVVQIHDLGPPRRGINRGLNGIGRG